MDRVSRMSNEYDQMMIDGELRAARIDDERKWILDRKDWDSVAEWLARPENTDRLSDFVFAVWEAITPDRPFLKRANEIIVQCADEIAEKRVG